MRKVPLVTNYVYHIFTRSIDKKVVFKDDIDYIRFIESIKYYIYEKLPFNFAAYFRLKIKMILYQNMILIIEM